MKISKRRKEIVSKLEPKEYELSEAVGLVKETATAKFDETVDAVVNLNLGNNQSFRGTISLPNLFGKEKRVIVFAKGSDADAATAAGAEVVGAEDLIDKIKGGWLEFDVAIATPDMMKEVGKLGPVLGRRGLMPSPKNGTVTNEVETAIKEFKKGKVEYRANKAGVVQVPVGKASLDGEKITQNFKAFFSEIMKAKPSNIKGEFLRSVHLSSTMGAGLKLNKKKID